MKKGSDRVSSTLGQTPFRYSNLIFRYRNISRSPNREMGEHKFILKKYQVNLITVDRTDSPCICSTSVLLVSSRLISRLKIQHTGDLWDREVCASVRVVPRITAHEQALDIHCGSWQRSLNPDIFQPILGNSSSKSPIQKHRRRCITARAGGRAQLWSRSS